VMGGVWRGERGGWSERAEVMDRREAGREGESVGMVLAW